MKGHNLDSFYDSHSISISYNVPSKHVYLDFPCAPLCLSLHTYNPLQEGRLCYVVGTFGMHKEYWETKGSMMEIEEIPRFEGVNLDLIKAERSFKKSLACAASKEEVDYSNGKLSKEDLTRLVIRLKMLQRNIELKGKALEGNMSEPSLLGVLKKKI